MLPIRSPSLSIGTTSSVRIPAISAPATAIGWRSTAYAYSLVKSATCTVCFVRAARAEGACSLNVPSRSADVEAGEIAHGERSHGQPEVVDHAVDVPGHGVYDSVFRALARQRPSRQIL